MTTQQAHKREDSFGIGDAVVVAAPSSQSPSGQWLGQVCSLGTDSKITFRFFYAQTYNPQKEISAYAKVAGRPLREREVVLSDWHHTVDISAVVGTKQVRFVPGG